MTKKLWAVVCEEAGICGAGTREDMLKLKEYIKGVDKSIRGLFDKVAPFGI